MQYDTPEDIPGDCSCFRVALQAGKDIMDAVFDFPPLNPVEEKVQTAQYARIIICESPPQSLIDKDIRLTL